jgi:hypothetical protein
MRAIVGWIKERPTLIFLVLQGWQPADFGPLGISLSYDGTRNTQFLVKNPSCSILGTGEGVWRSIEDGTRGVQGHRPKRVTRATGSESDD